MITAIIIVVFLIVAGIKFAVALNEDNPAGIRNAIIIAVVGVVAGFLQPYSFEKVDNGYKGLKISLVGTCYI
jgi:hypothetical protein